MTKISMVEEITSEISLSFLPITEIDTAEKLTELIKNLGWQLPDNDTFPGTLPDLQLQDLLDAVYAYYETPNTENFILLAIELAFALENLSTLNSSLRALLGAYADFRDNSGIKDEFAKRLINYLIVVHFEKNHPQVYSILTFFGIVESVHVDEDITLYRSDHFKKTIYWDRLLKIFQNPGGLMHDVYQWETDFDADKFLNNLFLVARSFGLAGGIYSQPPVLQNALGRASDDSDELRFPIHQVIERDSYAELGARLSSVPETSTGNKGIGLLPTLFGITEIDHIINENWKVKFSANGSLDSGLGLLLKPSEGFSILTDLLSSPQDSVSASTSLSLEYTPTEKFQVLAVSGLTIDIEKISVNFTAEKVSSENDPELIFKFNLHNLEIRIGNSEEDGFIDKLLSGNEIQGNLDLTIGWSSKNGLFFEGSGSLELTIPVHKQLGPLFIQAIHLRLDFGTPNAITFAATFGAQLGPIYAAVEKLGIKFDITTSSSSTLGIEFDGPTFVPPTGVALKVDFAGICKGAGGISVDRENHRYYGMLNLELKKIGITGFVGISTRLPDGSKGFSMVTILNVTFSPGYTLPYGFKLTGVGGMLGINRSINVDFLREELKNGVLNLLMFPPNPAENFFDLIDASEKAFTMVKGRHFFGPFVQITWGSPIIFWGELGILIEIPSPLRIVLLGQFSLILPPTKPGEQKANLVEINLDILGELNFEKKYFHLDAVLVDSRIISIPLTGQAVIRFQWGSDALVITSIGGFHPKFQAPPQIGQLQRLELSLSSGKKIKISCNCYIALTTNTLQFGASCHAIAKKGKFSAEGWLYFDALFIFSPFSFIVDIGAGVAIKVGSKTLLEVRFELTFSGVKPWRVKGKMKFKVFKFVKVTIRVNVKWGSGTPPPLPSIDPWDDLYNSLNESTNYAGLLPPGKEMLVTLKELDDPTGTIVLDSSGQIEWRERVLPLNFHCTRYGKAKPLGDPVYGLGGDYTQSRVEINGHAIEPVLIKEDFARGDCQEMSNSEKLSTPSFEKFDGGFLVGSQSGKFSSNLSYDLFYENKVIDVKKHTVVKAKPSSMEWQLGRCLIKNGSTIRNTIFYSGNQKYVDKKVNKKITYDEELFSVVSTENLHAVTTGLAQQDIGTTYAEARNNLDQYLASHPDKRDQVQIVPIQEVRI